MITALQCISLFTAITISTHWPSRFTIIEKTDTHYIARNHIIPYVDQLPGVIDARLTNGRMKMTESMKKGGVLLFIDVNNVKKINELFGREVGDAYIASVVSEIQKTSGDQTEVYRLGGDEFAVVLSNRSSPKQIQALTIAIENAVGENSQDSLKPAIQRAGAIQIQKLATLSGLKSRQKRIDYFRDKTIRYARASVSIGAAYIDPINPAKTQELAEDRARVRKIQIKYKAGLGVAKYGSSLEVDTTKKPSFVLEIPPDLIDLVNFPSFIERPLPAHIKPLTGQPAAYGHLLVFDHPEFSIVEAFDEFHRSTFWVEDKTQPKSVPSILHTSAVTVLPSLITPEGKQFDEKFTSSNKHPRARIEFKLAGLMHFNYFKDGVESGDRALRLMAELLQKNVKIAIQKTIKEELRAHLRLSDIIFSGMGSDFIVFIENISESVALEIQKRVVSSVANSSRIKNLIDQELAYLESDPATASLVPKLREALDPDKLVASDRSQFKFFEPTPERKADLKK